MWFVVVNPFFSSLCPNILESDTPLRCSEGPAEGTIQSCLPDPSVFEILQMYNGCLNYRPPFPPLGFSPMALIQHGRLSPRYPFKLGTKPAVSLPDLLTPHRVLCASVSDLAARLYRISRRISVPHILHESALLRGAISSATY